MENNIKYPNIEKILKEEAKEEIIKILKKYDVKTVEEFEAICTGVILEYQTRAYLSELAIL